MKLRRLVLGATLLVSVLLLVAGVGLWLVLRADAPTDAARDRAAVPVLAPHTPVRTAPRTPPAGGCVAWVRVADLEGAPLAGADVGFIQHEAEADGARSEPRSWALEQTDDTGRARLEGLPCGRTWLWAGWGADSPLRTEQEATLLAGRESQVELALEPAALVRLRVVDLHGSPVPMALVTQEGDPGGRVALGALAQEAPGVFLAAVGVGSPTTLLVHAADMGPLRQESHDEEVVFALTLDDLSQVDEDGVVEEREVELDIDRVVQVHCLGQPGEACTGVEPIQCTEPLVPVGSSCRTSQGVTACICPPGAAAVRGGGATVRVDPDAREVWLDLSFGGAITGRALVDGQPAACVATLFRIPTGLEDLPRGGILGREARCADDGRFLIEGVPPGDWYVELRGADFEGLGSNPAAQAEPARVGDRLVDIGDVDLFGGGGIEGIALDGLTAEPLRYAPVMALRQPQAGGRSTPAFAEVNEAGVFSFSGLLPGTWEVFVATSPFRRVEVVVEEGLLTDGVEITTSEATVLEDNGFALGGSAERGFLVTEVDPVGPAAAAGLQEGDEVVGVTVFGLDSTVLPEALSGRLASGLLGHWGGPGVGLVIDREGTLMDVALD